MRFAWCGNRSPCALFASQPTRNTNSASASQPQRWSARPPTTWSSLVPEIQALCARRCNRAGCAASAVIRRLRPAHNARQAGSSAGAGALHVGADRSSGRRCVRVRSVKMAAATSGPRAARLTPGALKIVWNALAQAGSQILLTPVNLIYVVLVARTLGPDGYGIYQL